MMKPNPHSDSMWRWALWEVIIHEGSAHIGLVPLLKRFRKAVLFLRPGEQKEGHL